MLKKSIIYIILIIIGHSVFSQDVKEYGQASYYANKFHGRKTASGEVYNKNLYTAAHRTLPFGTIVTVVNTSNNKKVKVKINDRGPFKKKRIIDLSLIAAKDIGLIQSGYANVIVTTTEYNDNSTENNNFISKVKLLNNGYYNKTMKKQVPKGMGVQVGSFYELNNLLVVMESIEKQFKEDVFLFVTSDKKGKKLYKISFGEYSKRSKADKMKKFAQKQGIEDCFIVKYK